MPPTIPIHFSADPHNWGGSQYTQNLNIVITEQLKNETWNKILGRVIPQLGVNFP